MDTQGIDQRVKKILDKAGDFYSPEADKAKERIWKQIQTRVQPQSKQFVMRYLVAASVILFILSLIIIMFLLDCNYQIFSP